MAQNSTGAILRRQQHLTKTGIPVFMHPFFTMALNGNHVLPMVPAQILMVKYNLVLMKRVQQVLPPPILDWIQGTVLLRTGMVPAQAILSENSAMTTCHWL